MRVANNQVVVSVNAVNEVYAFVPLKYDSKVKIGSLRLKLLIPFVIIQLEMRGIPYAVEDAGSITTLQRKLREWNQTQHRGLIEADAEDDLVEVPDEIEVLFDDSKPDWTIDKLYEVHIIGNAKKKKKK